MGERASDGNAHRRALRPRKPQKSRPGGNGYADGWTAHAEQSETPGNYGGNLCSVAVDCANHTAANGLNLREQELSPPTATPLSGSLASAGRLPSHGSIEETHSRGKIVREKRWRLAGFLCAARNVRCELDENALKTP